MFKTFFLSLLIINTHTCFIWVTHIIKSRERERESYELEGKS